MAVSIILQINLSKNSNSLSAYTLSADESDAAVTGELGRPAETWNNVVSYSGVFATMQPAVAAVLTRISAPVEIFAIEAPGIDAATNDVVFRQRLELRRIGAKGSGRLLGRKSSRGTWLAA